MKDFKLAESLKKTTMIITSSSLCEVLLNNNAKYPWFILVPRRAGITEIFELTVEDQQQLMKEISDFSSFIKRIFNADKINVAALGNVEPQLHIHIIARYRTDASWPRPVWSDAETIPYESLQLNELMKKIKNEGGM